MYNYIYGLTNVTLPNFAAGIFVGSFKPYLLDSYLGYFGKQIVDGDFAVASTSITPASTITDAITTTTITTTSALPQVATDMQDFILLLALGVSVLIGTFASQLAGDTWDTIQKEIQTDKEAKRAASRELGLNHTSTYDEESILRKVMGLEVPEWVVGMQIAYQEANQRINNMIQTEYSAKVWNYTSASTIPSFLDPAYFRDSPEKSGDPQGFNFISSLLDGVALSPCLIQAFFKYSDPQFNETQAQDADVILMDFNTKSSLVHNNEGNTDPRLY
jgi:hypothetical protein